MDVYDEENEVKILHVDVELQSLFGTSSNAVLSNLKQLSSDQPPLVPVRKDRLLFTGAPPTNVQSNLADFNKRILLLNNIHWALTDVDLIDVHIFENPRKMNKSEGVALIEFRTVSGAEAAVKDEGKCWSSKQGDRSVTIVPVPVEAISLLVELNTKYGSWNRTPQFPLSLLGTIYTKLGKPLPVNAASGPMVSATTGKTQPNKLPIPLAVQVLLDKREKAANKATCNESAAHRGPQ